MEDIQAVEVIKRLQLDVKEAQDNILCANIAQALPANEHWSDKFPFQKGHWGVLSTLHRQRDYKAKGKKQVVKFMPHYDGPYIVTNTAADVSTITVNMLNNPNTFPTFHTSQVLPFVEDDKELFPSPEQEHPQLVVINGKEEFYVDWILDECRWGRGTQYLC